MREEWRGRVDLQAVALCPIDLLADEFGDRVAAIVAKSGGLLGGVTRASIGNHGAPLDNIDALLDRVFALATRHELDIDLHVDETHDPAAATLPFVARAAMRHGYKGRVVCGHCCSLAMQPESEVDRTLDLVGGSRNRDRDAADGQYVFAGPQRETARRDGAASPSSTKCSGAASAWRPRATIAATAFYAYGDHDVLDTFRQAVRILHLDHPLSGTPALVGTTPSSIGEFAGPRPARRRRAGPAHRIQRAHHQ